MPEEQIASTAESVLQDPNESVGKELAILDVKPGWLSKEVKILGTENLGKEDVIIPRVTLCQSSSDERKPQHAKYIEGLKEGDWFNTATKEIYGSWIKVIPALPYKTRLKFASKTDKTIVCSSLNAKDGGKLCATCEACPHSKFSTKIDNGKEVNVPPECIHFQNYLCLVVSAENKPVAQDVCVTSMKRTSAKAGKTWNTLIVARGASSFAGIYKLTSALGTNKDGNSYLVPVVNNSGWAGVELYKKGEEFYTTYSVKGVKTDMEEEIGDEDLKQANDIPF